ncbi:hypothetical protein HK100_012029 [Physocladia obscura]|uniref:Uncharacterized protein n=1 Tax=Physocladia obscura TaxID=109957 RepID=A0AAD5T0C8_9FUNG|nr:hypothetical protein HK100_012029 [Physocladia obscura]
MSATARPARTTAVSPTSDSERNRDNRDRDKEARERNRKSRAALLQQINASNDGRRQIDRSHSRSRRVPTPDVSPDVTAKQLKSSNSNNNSNNKNNNNNNSDTSRVTSPTPLRPKNTSETKQRQQQRSPRHAAKESDDNDSDAEKSSSSRKQGARIMRSSVDAIPHINNRSKDERPRSQSVGARTARRKFADYDEETKNKNDTESSKPKYKSSEANGMSRRALPTTTGQQPQDEKEVQPTTRRPPPPPQQSVQQQSQTTRRYQNRKSSPSPSLPVAQRTPSRSNRTRNHDEDEAKKNSVAVQKSQANLKNAAEDTFPDRNQKKQGGDGEGGVGKTAGTTNVPQKKTIRSPIPIDSSEDSGNGDDSNDDSERNRRKKQQQYVKKNSDRGNRTIKTQKKNDAVVSESSDESSDDESILLEQISKQRQQNNKQKEKQQPSLKKDQLNSSRSSSGSTDSEAAHTKPNKKQQQQRNQSPDQIKLQQSNKFSENEKLAASVELKQKQKQPQLEQLKKKNQLEINNEADQKKNKLQRSPSLPNSDDDDSSEEEPAPPPKKQQQQQKQPLPPQQQQQVSVNIPARKSSVSSMDAALKQRAEKPQSPLGKSASKNEYTSSNNNRDNKKPAAKHVKEPQAAAEASDSSNSESKQILVSKQKKKQKEIAAARRKSVEIESDFDSESPHRQSPPPSKKLPPKKADDKNNTTQFPPPSQKKPQKPDNTDKNNNLQSPASVSRLSPSRRRRRKRLPIKYLSRAKRRSLVILITDARLRRYIQRRMREAGIVQHGRYANVPDLQSSDSDSDEKSSGGRGSGRDEDEYYEDSDDSGGYFDGGEGSSEYEDEDEHRRGPGGGGSGKKKQDIGQTKNKIDRKMKQSGDREDGEKGDNEKKNKKKGEVTEIQEQFSPILPKSKQLKIGSSSATVTGATLALKIAATTVQNQKIAKNPPISPSNPDRKSPVLASSQSTIKKIKNGGNTSGTGAETPVTTPPSSKTLPPPPQQRSSNSTQKKGKGGKQKQVESADESTNENKAGKNFRRQQKQQQQLQQSKSKASKTIVNDDSDSTPKKSDKNESDITVAYEISQPSKNQVNKALTDVTKKSKIDNAAISKAKSSTVFAVVQTMESDDPDFSAVSRKKPTLPTVTTESDANTNAYSTEYDYDDDDEEEERGRGRSRSRGPSVFRHNSQSGSPLLRGVFKKPTAAEENAGVNGSAANKAPPAGSNSSDFDSDDDSSKKNKAFPTPAASTKTGNFQAQLVNSNTSRKKQLPTAAAIIIAKTQQKHELREALSSSPPLRKNDNRESRYSSVFGDGSVYRDADSDKDGNNESAHDIRDESNNATAIGNRILKSGGNAQKSTSPSTQSNQMQTSKFIAPNQSAQHQQKRDDSDSPGRNDRVSRYSSVFGDKSGYGSRRNSDDDSDDNSMLQKSKSLNLVTAATKNVSRPEQQQKRKDFTSSVRNDRESLSSSLLDGSESSSYDGDGDPGKETFVGKNAASIWKSQMPKPEERRQPQQPNQKVISTEQQQRQHKQRKQRKRADSSDSAEEYDKNSENNQLKSKRQHQQQQNTKATTAVVARKRHSRSNKSNSSLASDSPPSLRRADLTETPPTNTRLSELSISSSFAAPAPVVTGEDTKSIISSMSTPTESKSGTLRKLWQTVAGTPPPAISPTLGTATARTALKKSQSSDSGATSPPGAASPIPRKPSLALSSTSTRSSVASNPVRLSSPAPPTTTGVPGTSESAKRGVLGWIFGKKPVDAVTSTSQPKSPLAAPQQEVKGKKLSDNEKTLSIVSAMSDSSEVNSDSDVSEILSKKKPVPPSPLLAFAPAVSKSLPRPQNQDQFESRVRRNEERKAGGSLGHREQGKSKSSTTSDSGDDSSDGGAVARNDQFAAVDQQRRAAKTAGSGSAGSRRERTH